MCEQGLSAPSHQARRALAQEPEIQGNVFIQTSGTNKSKTKLCLSFKMFQMKQKCFVSFSLSGYSDKKSRSKIKITVLKKLKYWFISIQFHI